MDDSQQNLREFQAAIILMLENIEINCRDHDYDVLPTLVLRHRDDDEKSMVLSKDTPENVVSCINRLHGKHPTEQMTIAEAEKIWDPSNDFPEDGNA